MSATVDKKVTMSSSFAAEYAKFEQVIRCMAAYARIKNCTMNDAANHAEALQRVRGRKDSILNLRGHDVEFDRAIDMSADPRLKQELEDFAKRDNGVA